MTNLSVRWEMGDFKKWEGGDLRNGGLIPLYGLCGTNF